MKFGSTLFLKIIVFFLGIVVLGLCIFVLPEGLQNNSLGMFAPLTLVMYSATIPFFIGIYQIFKLLNFIDSDQTFSLSTIKMLTIIKFCTLFIGLVYGFSLPYAFKVTDLDDAPGLFFLWLIFTFAPISISVFTSILEKLLKNAIDIKLENDLTV